TNTFELQEDSGGRELIPTPGGGRITPVRRTDWIPSTPEGFLREVYVHFPSTCLRVLQIFNSSRPARSASMRTHSAPSTRMAPGRTGDLPRGQMEIVRPFESRLVPPEASVASAVMTFLPPGSTGPAKTQNPFALAVVVPRIVLPSRIVTTLPG